MKAPAALVGQWEAAYRQYTDASRWAGRAAAGDPAAAETLASASWAVATTWRDMATTVVLPWWVLAAVRSAAEAFEQQARTWHASATRMAARSVISEPWPPDEGTA